MPKPQDKKALQRLLGMVKYLAQYIPSESDITTPLRELLKELSGSGSQSMIEHCNRSKKP